ncbi:type II toxin-antitoxin system VapC family toxin [bacterium]|nr:MAG: type II toxin-antitoxin system VapC family toxin [bacterium]
MVIADTNIFIYIAQHKLPADIFGGRDVGFASVTRIEAIGFDRLPVREARWLEEAFRSREQIYLSEAVLLRAIEIRQIRKMSLGDSIIAATALVQEAELWTANTADFAGIAGLKIHNPLSS